MRTNCGWRTVFCAVSCFALLSPVAVNAGDLVDPGGLVEDIVADPVRNYLYASLSTGEVVAVSFASKSVTARVPVDAKQYKIYLAVAPDGSKLFVTLGNPFDVAVYSLPGLSLLTVYDLSATLPLTGIAASNTRLYVGGGARTFSIVDTNTGSEIYFKGLYSGWYYDYFGLSADGTTLFSMIRHSSPGSIYQFDVSHDTLVWVGEECCHTCLGSSSQSMALSPDGSLLYLAAGSPYHVQVYGLPGTGMLSKRHEILTGPYPNSVVPSKDGTLVYVGWNKFKFAVVRTSDWLPFRVEPLQGEVGADGLVLSSSEQHIAAAIEYGGSSSYPNRIEVVDISDKTPNRGGIRLTPVDSVEVLPIETAYLSNYRFSGASGLVDITPGVVGRAPLESGEYEFELSAYLYASQTHSATVTSGNWTDLGVIEMESDDDYPDPQLVCVSPAVHAGKTAVVQVHGLNFIGEATVSSLNPDISIDDFTWIDWTTIEATVTVDSSAPPGPTSQDIRVDNPGSDYFGYGNMFILEPQVSTLGFLSSGVVIDEDAATVGLGVVRSNKISGEVSVDFATSASTADADSDFSTTGGTLTWLDGEFAAQTITVPILQDTLVEGSEEFTVDLSNVVGGEFGAITESTVTIIDDDASYLQFDSPSYSVDEDGGPAQLTVTRTVKTDVAVSVDYVTSNGTAVEPGDYTLTAGTLSWVAGDSSPQTIDVPVFDDGDAEGNETLTVTLSNPSADAVLGNPFEAELTIVDNDGSVLTLSTDTIDVNERDGSATVSVPRTNSVSGAVTVNYATSDGTATDGQDYTAASGTLSWADGEGGAMSFSIPLIDDGLLEPDETVNIDLSSPTGPSAIGVPGSAVLTIADNDGAGLQFSSDAFQASETDGTVQIAVQRVGDSTGVATVQYATGAGSATAGADYEHVAGTLSWAGGDGTDKAFAVTLIDDGLTEFVETVTLSLSNPTGNASLGDPATATLNIEDDESIETRINTIAEYAQMRPRVATGATGAAVVVWDSWRQDGWGWGVYGQRLNAAGDPVGGEFHVNVTTDEDQMHTAVAAAADGSFVVVWQGDVASGTAIFARRYDNSGTPLGGEFVVNSSTSGNQTVPQVAFDGNGRFMVVWQGRDVSGAGVFARVFGADGAPLADEFAVNTTTPLSQDLPAVAGSSVGGFVVVWESYTQDDGLSDGVIGRRFGSTGAALGGEILVNDSVAGDQELPAVAVAGDGRFIVVWEDDAGIDGSLGSIQGRWFDGVGSPIGGEFQINVFTVGDQGRPAVAAESDGRAVVVWEGRGGQDGSEIGVFERALNDDGTFATGESQLNTYISQSQYQPAVACSSIGGAFGVWTSEGQDGSVEGVYGVSWPLPPTRLIFTDGFESGDTTAW